MEEQGIEDVLDYWFNDLTEEQYWMRDDAVDQVIRERFSATFEKAAAGGLDHWQDTPEGALALTIVLDQFPRNMFRDDPRTWATDDRAMAVAEAAIARGFDRRLDNFRCQFLYMPYEHSEDLAKQERSLKLFKRLDLGEEPYSFVVRHHEIIQRFGRFPHRNKVLGRASTPEEIAFLEEPNSSF